MAGIDVDIAQYIAQQLGLRLNLIEQTADENVEDDLRNAVWKGHYLGGQVADVMLHVPYDREFSLRNTMVFFIGPYFRERVGMAWNPEKVGEQANLAVFRYNKIGVEIDTIADFHLSSVYDGTILKNVVHFADMEKATGALLSGETAGAAGLMSQLEAGLAENLSQFRTGTVAMSGLMRGNWLLGSAVKHTYRQLGYTVGDILGDMVRNGEMKKIFSRHGVTFTPPPADLIGGTAQ